MKLVASSGYDASARRADDASANRLPARRPGDALAAFALAGPAIVLLLILFILPVAAIIVIALTDWQFGMRSLHFVGLANFAAISADEGFIASLRNTLVYASIVMPGAVLGGLGIALLIESGETLRNFYRAIHFLPFMTTRPKRGTSCSKSGRHRLLS